VTTALSSTPAARESISHRLAERVGQGKYRLWFESARFEIQAGTLRVAVPNRFVADWIDTHFYDALLELAEQELGEGAEVKLCVEAALGEAAPPAPTPPVAALIQAAKPAPQPRVAVVQAAPSPEAAAPAEPVTRAKALRYDLESFIVGPANEMAFTAANRLVDDPDVRMNPLFIHGGCGMGKTHLLQGLCKRFVAKHPNARWCYTTAEQFTNQYIQAVRTNRLGDFRRRLRSLDLLAVDDVHFLSNKNATQSEFLHTFDAIDLQGAKLVLASDAHPKLIEQMTDSLISRFMSGMVVRVDPPDRQTRLKVVASMAQRRGLTLLEGVAEQLADQPTRSVREIEGMVTRLAAFTSIVRGGASASMIGRTAVAQFLGTDAPPTAGARPIRLEQIIQVVAQHTRVERAQLLSKSRHKRIVLARSMVIYLARQLTTLSFPELAKAMGRPNHSTIVTASQRIGQQVRGRAPVQVADDLPMTTMDQLADDLRQQIITAR
jgi:chromosomal replication initiator protein